MAGVQADVLDRISARNAERVAKKEVSKVQLQIQDFYDSFDKLRSTVEDAISSGAPLATVMVEFYSMQGLLSDSCSFLPSSERKRCFTTLEKIAASISNSAQACTSQGQAQCENAEAGATTSKSRRPRFKFSADAVAAAEAVTMNAARDAAAKAAALAQSAETAAQQRGEEAMSEATGGVRVADLRGQVVLFVPPAEHANSPSAVFVDRLVDCVVVVAYPLTSSMFVRQCRNTTVVVACHQLRLYDCESVTLAARVTSVPILEASKGIKVGAWSGEVGVGTSAGATRVGEVLQPYCALETVAAGSAISQRGVVTAVAKAASDSSVTNKAMQMRDFGWLHSTASPNWRPLESEDVQKAAVVDSSDPDAVVVVVLEG